MPVKLANGKTASDPRLGRLVQFDEKSRNHPIRAILSPKQLSKPRGYTWSVGKYLDQGPNPYCVGYSWAHELIARPCKVPNIENADGTKIYKRAQDLDEWEGSAYDGSSVLGGAKAVQEFGFITEYNWAFGLNDLILAVGYKGPAVLGINWYSEMFEVDSNGFIHASGDIEGGHAILCYRVSVKLKEFSLWNSWGCYDDQTEILTATGWKFFPDLKNDEQVATLNPLNHEIEYHKIIGKHCYKYDGNLLRYNSRDVDLLVTPNHKLYFCKESKKNKRDGNWKLRPAEDIKIKHFSMKKDGKWKGFKKEFVEISGRKIPINLWMEFMGYFISEGYAYKSTSLRKPRWRKRTIKPRRKMDGSVSTATIRETITYEEEYNQTSYITGICQIKSKNIAKIEKCLSQLPWKFIRCGNSWTTNNKTLYTELEELGKAPQKHIPEYIKALPSEQLKILFDAMMLGDGYFEKNVSRAVYYTSSKKLADDFQEILLKIGYAGDITIENRIGRKTTRNRNNNDIGTKNTIVTRELEYRIGIKRKELEPKKEGGWIPDKVPYSGSVHCVTVKNHIIYVRRNGNAVWCGNSDWGINGTCKVSFDDMERLLSEEGEACIPIGRKNPC